MHRRAKISVMRLPNYYRLFASLEHHINIIFSRTSLNFSFAFYNELIVVEE